ncbi:metal-dependent hydrolase [Candidatus Micrarchaeota archaeon]|nr:metal-dependent hydrolase [Candidatus Micrarchaeota archaeon]
MNYQAHAVIGGVLCGTLAYFLGTGFLGNGFFGIVFALIIGGLSALVPDLDHDTSKGRKIMDWAVIVFSLILAYFASSGVVLSMLFFFFALVGAYFVIFKFFKPKHRGITHTIVACFVFSILLFFLAGKDFAIFGFVGYLSHLLADKEMKII